MKRLLPALVLIFSTTAMAGMSQGEYVARIADCMACHTTETGKPMAGGKKFPTPLGDIYATNITPDKTTGIGNYSYQDFEKAVRQGVARDGHALYPAMPYPSYVRLSDDDMQALYNYFMHEVTAVNQPNRENDIPWLLSARWPMHIWNWLFIDDEAKKLGPKSDEAAAMIARGAYLAEGPGHCGACHTPRGFAMQEKAFDSSSPVFLSGALTDGWYAPDLRHIRLSQPELMELLRQGRSLHHSVAGPMGEVVTQSTQYLTDQDSKALALYLLSISQKPSPLAKANLKPNSEGGKLYFRYCSTCHGTEGQGADNNVPTLAGNGAVMAPDPSNLIRVMAFGAETPATQGNIPYRMPGYQGVMSDQEMLTLVNYIRGTWGQGATKVNKEDMDKIMAPKK